MKVQKHQHYKGGFNTVRIDEPELHFWLNLSERFTSPTGFPGLKKDRGNHDYKDYMDHEDLTWKWLYNWCEVGMQLSSEYQLWGTTPWNYSHPYWENWTNIEWYNYVNIRFLEN